MLHNVHERVIDAPIERLGQLLADLGGPDDRLWPSPAWVPMVLDRPLAVGADGGHGPIRYTVTEYEPGRRVRFAFRPECGIDGTHELRLEEVGGGRTLVRHELDCELSGTVRGLVLEKLHDAVLEDLLDNAERESTGTVAQPARWSPLVAVIHRLTTGPEPRAASIPRDATLARETVASYGGVDAVDLLDAWSMPNRHGLPSDPAVWADAVFRRPPGWVVALLGLRQAVVGLVRIERGSEESFATRARTEREVLLGEDASHLDFRASLHVSERAVTLSTIARRNNARGRLYLVPVRLLHPIVVRAMLARAWRDLARRSAEAPLTQRACAPPGGGSG